VHAGAYATLLCASSFFWVKEAVAILFLGGMY
jgi:hypothetical protein